MKEMWGIGSSLLRQMKKMWVAKISVKLRAPATNLASKVYLS